MVWLSWLCGLSLEEVSGTQQVTLVYTMHFHAEGCVHVWTVVPKCYCSSALRFYHVPENKDCSADHHHEDHAMAENHYAIPWFTKY